MLQGFQEQINKRDFIILIKETKKYAGTRNKQSARITLKMQQTIADSTEKCSVKVLLKP